jgi:hypothetical protein
VGSADTYVHAVGAMAGKLTRTYHAGGKVLMQPVVAGGMHYVAATNGRVLAFRLS